MDFGISDWSWLDYSVVAILMISTLCGFFRGFVREVLSLCTWVGAVYIALHFASAASGWFESIIHLEQIRWVAAFVVLMLLSLVLGMVCTYIFAKLIEHSPFKGLDRFLGMAFGFLRGLLIMSMGIFALSFSALAKEPEWKKSSFVALGQDIAHGLLAEIPPDFKKQYGISSLEELAPDLPPKSDEEKD